MCLLWAWNRYKTWKTKSKYADAIVCRCSKNGKADADSFLCTGKCQNEYDKWKSLTHSLQYIFNEDSSENEKLIPLTYNERENFWIAIDANWWYYCWKNIDDPLTIRIATQISLFIPRTICFHEKWTFLKNKYNLNLSQAMYCLWINGQAINESSNF